MIADNSNMAQDGCRVCGIKQGPGVDIRFKMEKRSVCVTCAYEIARELADRTTKWVTRTETDLRRFKNALEGLSQGIVKERNQ